MQTIEQVRASYEATAGREFQASGRYAVVSCTMKEGRGGMFAIVELRDPSGSLVARCFDAACLERLSTTPAIDVRLRVGEYNGAISAVVQSFESAQLSEQEVLRYAGLDPEAHALRMAQVRTWLDECDGTVYGDVLHEIFDDERTWRQFCMAPAAVRMHHAEPGGLVRHICEVGRAGLALLDSLEPIGEAAYDRAYFLAGVLLHDIGKIDTYTAPPTISYTAQGQLVEHQIYSVVRLAKACAARGVPSSIEARLIHIVEQAHGAYRHAEWQDPLGVEAKALAAADYYSSRLGVSDKERRSHDALDRLIASDSAAAAATAAAAAGSSNLELPAPAMAAQRTTAEQGPALAAPGMNGNGPAGAVEAPGLF